jgi:ABC-type Fe3+/spermidine/putrescine transport system ATPase subunit
MSPRPVDPGVYFEEFMLEIEGITKSYDGKPLLRGISFTVEQDETVCLLGPSGSGKSTLLLMISGLEVPDAGRILWEGEDLASTPPHLRDFGLVFQDYALFPHLDVAENIAFGLRMKHWSRDRIGPRILEVLDLVNLGGFDKRKVTDLSGGEQQRVALARALAPRPRLLMFDEPLGALDRALREELLDQLRRILRETRLPALYVTHDQAEASAIGDRILLLHAGEIVRAGSAAEVWASPGSAWAAEFLGLGTVLVGRWLDGKVHSDQGDVTLAVKCAHSHKKGDQVTLLVRPHPAAGGTLIRGRVADVVFHQDQFKVTLDSGLFAYVDAAPKIGQELSLKVTVECLG